MRLNIASRRPVSSPTLSRWPASGGNSPAFPAAPRCLRRASRLARHSPAIPRSAGYSECRARSRCDCTSGTLAATSVPMARANRAVSALRKASPSTGIFRRERIPPQPSRRGADIAVKANRRPATSNGQPASTVALHELAGFEHDHCVGNGIFDARIFKNGAKRGTTKFSSMKIDAQPTSVSRPDKSASR